MNLAAIVLDVLLMSGGTVLLMLLLGALSRRLLGVRISAGRVILAGAVGLGAGVGFESQFVWRAADYTPAMIPVLFGIIILVAIAVLVVAELVVPQGTLPRPDQWGPLLRQSFDRNRRYLQLLRIIARHRLFALKLGDAQNDQRRAERRQQAAALKSALEEAGGAFVKMGQLLSTRPDVLAPEFIDALGALQQQVPPVPWPEIEPALTRALGRPHAEVFASFAEEPFAAASIGQVHAASLPTGEQVAVKVRRPGIVPMVERDIDIAERLARRLARSSEEAARFGVEQLVASLTESLRDELDYGLEAANIVALAEVQQQLPEQARVRIPRHHPELSTEALLVMERISGSTLSDRGALVSIDPENRRALARRLLAAILAQIMDAGVFHSDLHPGNIIIDDRGALVLLDFGSIGRIDSDTRARLGEVLLAFARRDAGAFTAALFAFVDLADVADENGLRRAVAAFMARRLGPGARLDASMFADVVAILADHGLTVPAELTVPFRAIATVEGSLMILDPGFDFVGEAGQYAQARITEATRPTSIATAVSGELLSALPILKRLPQRVDRITGTLADGRFGMNMRVFADPRDRDFLRELLSLAVVTFLAGIFGIMAAMLLTSAAGPQLTTTLTLFQVFGYLFLVAAGILTLRALFDILRHPTRQRDRSRT
ncbi:MAG: AarF/ABC1/UbiB kinase family protein [Actinobacteria bacterium]|nr:AarF/ABC1/UbiB kinase family protein [Actinomycetota bacterium]